MKRTATQALDEVTLAEAAKDLPAGWTASISTTYQTVFYHFAATGVSQYERPAVGPSQKAARTKIPLVNVSKAVNLKISTSHSINHASPVIEWLRSRMLRSLRTFFDQQCSLWLMMPSPKEAFNRWIYLQLAVPTALYGSSDATHRQFFEGVLPVDLLPLQPLDPLLPCPAAAATSDVLRQELRAEIPARCDRNDFSSAKVAKVLALLTSYTNHVCTFLARWLHVSPDRLTQLLKTCSLARSELTSDSRVSLNPWYQSQVTALVVEAASQLEPVIARMQSILAENRSLSSATAPLSSSASFSSASVSVASASSSAASSSAASSSAASSSAASCVPFSPSNSSTDGTDRTDDHTHATLAALVMAACLAVYRARALSQSHSQSHSPSLRASQLGDLLTDVRDRCRPLVDLLVNARIAHVNALLAARSEACLRQLTALSERNETHAATEDNNECSALSDESKDEQPRAATVGGGQQLDKGEGFRIVLAPNETRSGMLVGLILSSECLGSAHVTGTGIGTGTDTDDWWWFSARPEAGWRLVDCISVSAAHFDKLADLYQRHSQASSSVSVSISASAAATATPSVSSVYFSGSSASSSPLLQSPLFRRAIYCLLRRYGSLLDSTLISSSSASASTSASHESLVDATASDAAILSRASDVASGWSASEGSGFHAAAPESVFALLNRSLRVDCEVFASPFNCYFPRFCSAFSDTDQAFGSLGSFFNFSPESGSFECNPPFSVEVMDACASWIEVLLLRASGPLSFTVFVPHWQDPPTHFIPAMSRSRFLTAKVIMPAYQHKYISGAQHVDEVSAGKGERYFAAAHETAAFVLQNAAGARQWPVEKSFSNALVQAFKQTRV